MDIKDIASRLANGLGASDDEKVFLIRNSPVALAAFMIDNNPGSVNLTLRRMGYTHLGFAPDPKALARQLEIMIERDDVEGMATVFKNFNLLPEPLTPEFIDKLVTAFNS